MTDQELKDLVAQGSVRPKKRSPIYHATVEHAVLYAYNKARASESSGGHEDPFVTQHNIRRRFRKGGAEAFAQAAERGLLVRYDDEPPIGPYYVITTEEFHRHRDRRIKR